MDLRSILSTSDNGDGGRDRERDRATPKAPPTPQQQQHQPHHHQQSPSSYQYREYGQPQSHPHPSPGPAVPPDYPHHPQHHSPANSYPPHSPYQTPSGYSGRPAPPPLQPTNSFHDARSPAGAMPIASPSATRQPPLQTANSGPPGAGVGYPFPATHSSHPEITSPGQRHQYPPAQYQPQRQESYSQSHGAPAHHGAPYGQQHVPQTPPIATPGGGHAYLHQRSQSTHSTPTPTSAHSQHQYGTPFAHHSPVTAHQPPPAEFNRQHSQPPTPLGPPPAAAQRQSISHAVYNQQPPSPYQQRISSITNPPQLVQAQTSPPQPPPQQLPPTPVQQRLSSSHGSRNPSTIEQLHRPTSQHEREHSMSVSPKTRVPSLPSSADRPSISAEIDIKPTLPTQAMVVDSDRAATPAKRKLEDRDLSPNELEHKEARPPPGEVNGAHVPSQTPIDKKVPESPVDKKISKSPPEKKAPEPSVEKPSKQRADTPVKTRSRHLEPPPWAQSARLLGKQPPNEPNFQLQKKVHNQVNGSASGGAPTTRHDSISRGVNSAPEEPSASDILGPWEPSITGVKPYEEVSKAIADFLFLNVVNSPEMGEINSRGIKFEIEAKLGKLIDKNTNDRVDRILDSEAILQDNGRTAFRSSMTEAHHKSFNDFLNQIVIQTDPRSKNGRVQLQYKHRREIDRFIELPPGLQNRLPGCMRSRLGSRSKNVRVRLTYEQKTRQVLAMIVKARVADLDLHFPMCPMDCRISINLEMDWDGPPEELENIAAGQSDRPPDRNKDRLSYKQGHYQVDLTQVTQQTSGLGGQRTDREHELEVELAPDAVLEQGRRAMDSAPHRYQELVEGFVDNIRVLARKARDF